MLKQRVITALCLVAIFLPTLFWLPPMFFHVALGVVMFAAASEWARLAEQSTKARLFYAVLLLAFCAVLLVSSVLDSAIVVLLGIGMLVWLVAVIAVFNYPDVAWYWLDNRSILLAGFCLLPAAIGALAYLRLLEGGEWWILYCVAVVAAADIGGYFAGRRWGKRKLAYRVSPGKTWEGFAGGLVLAQIVAVLFYLWWARAAIGSVESNQMWLFQLVALLQSSASVLGDLFESLLKRRVNVKDSGTLLPGHGGVLDRIDGLIAAVPLFVLCFIQLDWSAV